MKIIHIFCAISLALFLSVNTLSAKGTPADSAALESVELEEIVVVSSSRNEVSQRKAATAVNVTPRSVFQSTGSNTVAEVMNFQPGVRVEYSCSNCGMPQMRINGLEGEYTQILLDSHPIFSSLAGVYGIEQMPESMIERVEVIKGGGSALFGSNAVGGVVNIITRQPKRSSFELSNSTSLFEGGGADISTSLSGSIVSDDRTMGISLFSTVRDRDSYDRNGDGFSELPMLESTTVGFRGFYRISDGSRLTAEYHHMDEHRRGGDMLDRPSHEANISEELRHRINGGSVKYDYISADLKHRFSTYVATQSIGRDSYFGTNQDPNAYGKTQDATIVGGAQYTLKMDKFLFLPAEFTTGIEYNNNYLHDEMQGYNRDLAQLSENYGIYAQNEWRNDEFSMLIGARFDKHNKVKDPVLSPRASLRYRPWEPITFRVNYSSGYRAPQAYDEDLHVSAVGGDAMLIVLDPNLRPEYSNSATLSADFYKSFSSWSFNLIAEGFYTALSDIFALREAGRDAQGNILMEKFNASGAKVAGVNLEARMNYMNKVRLNGGLTYQSSFYDEAFEWSSTVDAQRKMFRSPDLYGYLTVDYLPIKELTISPSLTYTGSMLTQHYAGYIAADTEVMTPDFWDINFRVAYDLVLNSGLDIEFSAGVKNMLNSFQSDLDVGVDRDSKYIYGPSIPRTYFVGVKFTL